MDRYNSTLKKETPTHRNQSHMKTKIILSIVAVSMSFLITGCGSNPSQPGGFLSTDGEVKPVNFAALKIVIPDDSGILRPGSGAVVRDLVISNYSTVFAPHAYGFVSIEQKTPESFLVHSRTHNGTAGSGVKYTVNYEVKPGSGGGYSVDFQPKSRSEYQQGLIGKFPVPPFSESALRSYLKSFTLRYKFDIDSPYGSDSIMANFARLGVVRNSAKGFADPVTGKIYKQYFQMDYAGTTTNYTVEIFPYRSGSKAVVNMELPVVETSPNTVEFERIISDLRKQLTSIVQS